MLLRIAGRTECRVGHWGPFVFVHSVTTERWCYREIAQLSPAGLMGEGEQGPRPGPRACGGPRETSARGPAPCEDSAGRGLSAGNRARQRFWRATRTFWGPRNVRAKANFGLLIFRQIIKTVATRCILWLKCTKFDFGGGSAPEPDGGAYSAPPDPLAALRGPYF